MTRRRLSVVLVVLVLLVSGVALAQTPADIAELRVEANAGNASSQWLLGYYYINGMGVPQDYAQSMAWFRQAADQGDALAQFHLGYAYDIGQGVPQDYVQAHKWFNLSAARASAEDRERYAEVRDRVANLMTPAQIADAQKLAREWHAAGDSRQNKR
jgi:TPR repeat protein